MSFQFHKLSVLVVEDTAPMLKLVVSILETLGVGHIMTATNVKEGFKIFCKNKPDIVLTDWHMEPENGIEFISAIRKNKQSPNKMTPIIIMSGYSAARRVSLARDTGTTEFLVKPFSANDLAKRIAYVIIKPRDFIEYDNFFGPDRRRRNLENYRGPLRRACDQKQRQTA